MSTRPTPLILFVRDFEACLARQYDFRPAELQEVLATSFRDPDGNVFEVQQVLRTFKP